MFGYNPTVQDRSGEITGQGTMNAANSMAQGMGALGQGLQQGVQGITGALNQINALKFQAAQADGTIDIAHQLGMLGEGEKGNQTADYLRQLPWQSKSGLVSSLAPLITAQGNMAYRNLMAGVAQQRLDQSGAARAAKGTGINPWSGVPVQGAFSSGSTAADTQE